MNAPINKDQSPANVAARMLAAIEMHDQGMEMLRLRLQREHPDEFIERIHDRIAAFLRSNHRDFDAYLRPSKCPRFLPRS